MAVDLVGAVVGWLTAEAATRTVAGGRRLVLGDAQRRALRRVVRQAVADTVGGAGLPKHEAARLRTALLAASGPVRRIRAATATELRAAVAEWVRPLAPRGVSCGELSDELVTRILDGIEADARTGGPLRHVADWLWRDDATRLLEAIDGRFAAWEPPGADHARRGLPGGIPDFTGRDAALADLHARLARHDPDGRFAAVYAISGMGGVGKTTLAIQAAWDVAERYPDGGFFIDLHGFTAGIAPLSPEAALEQLLRDAGLPAGAIPLGVAARQARWRSHMASRKAIVVLDNAVDSAQVRPLLPGAPGSLVIVTSRRRLTALPEAEEIFLNVLSPVEAEELLLRVAGTHRAEDPEEVRRIVRLCGHLPLAIRIVAARLRREPAAPLSALVAELGQTNRLAELSPEGAGVEGRYTFRWPAWTPRRCVPYTCWVCIPARAIARRRWPVSPIPGKRPRGRCFGRWPSITSSRRWPAPTSRPGSSAMTWCGTSPVHRPCGTSTRRPGRRPTGGSTVGTSTWSTRRHRTGSPRNATTSWPFASTPTRRMRSPSGWTPPASSPSSVSTSTPAACTPTRIG
ncbi:hypothetical protein [Phytohabitans rumicis]|uniref:hypothetical protein n=1 Tax=Phytohabitans rumicis TaxID=1076125 RepID=UPI0015671ABC|nr:hypothetical protein [Phytohabitans rumicis]